MVHFLFYVKTWCMHIAPARVLTDCRKMNGIIPALRSLQRLHICQRIYVKMCWWSKRHRMVLGLNGFSELVVSYESCRLFRSSKTWTELNKGKQHWVSLLSSSRVKNLQKLLPVVFSWKPHFSHLLIYFDLLIESLGFSNFFQIYFSWVYCLFLCGIWFPLLYVFFWMGGSLLFLCFYYLIKQNYILDE